MEQALNLKLTTRNVTDYIVTTNNLLHTINQNSCMVLTNGAMTVKQYDFMVFIFKGLQIYVNNIRKEIQHSFEVDSMDFVDEDVTQYILDHRFIKVDFEDMIQFLQKTNNGNTRYISKKDLLNYLSQIQTMCNNLMLKCEFMDNNGQDKIFTRNLFSGTSYDGKNANELINMYSFDLLLSVDALPFILELFNTANGFGQTQIETILKLKSVNSKNLHFFICRYISLIKGGFDVNVRTLTKYLGINNHDRPYADLKDIIKRYNKEIEDTGTKITITPIKKGKKGQILKISLKQETTIKLPYKNTNNTDHSNCDNEIDVWF